MARTGRSLEAAHRACYFITRDPHAHTVRYEVVAGLLKGLSRYRQGGSTVGLPVSSCIQYDEIGHYIGSLPHKVAASTVGATRAR